MLEDTSEPVQAEINLELADYFAVQFWLWRRLVPSATLYFLLAILATSVVEALNDGTALSLVFHNIVTDWAFYVQIWAAAFAVILALMGGSVLARWRRSDLPRKMRVVANCGGMHVTFHDVDYHPEWANVKAVSEDRLAYFVRGMRFAIRIPKRGLDDSQRRTFEALVQANVPGSANRLRARPPQTP